MPGIDERDPILLQGLNVHPGLRARIESLLGAVEDAGGDLEKADAAERRMIEALRRMGNAALTAWARTGSRSACPTKMLCLTAFPTPHGRLLRDGDCLRRPGRPASLVRRQQGRLSSFHHDSTTIREALQFASGRRYRATLRRTARPWAFRGA